MPWRSIVLMVSILSLFFGIVYAYRARTYSVVTSLGVLVDSIQGHKITLLPLYRPFLWDHIRPAQYSFRFKKKKKQRKPCYSYGLNWRDKQRSFLGKAYGLNWRDKQRCAVKWLFSEKFFLKFVFSECNFTCVFICFFVCQSTFFILLIFSAEYFSRF